MTINLVVHKTQEAPPEFTSVPSGPQPSITTTPADNAPQPAAPVQPAAAQTAPRNTWLGFNDKGEVVAFGNNIDEIVAKAKAAGVDEPLIVKVEPARP